MTRGFLGAASAMALILGLSQPSVEAQEPRKGAYVGAIGGLNLAPGRDLDGDGNAFFAEDDKELGYLAGLVAGYQFGDLRLELEFARRDNGLDDLSVANGLGLVPAGTTATAGDVLAHSFMVNGHYAPARYAVAGIAPMLGVGVGVANVNYDEVQPAGSAQLVDDGGFGPAVQGIAGVERFFGDHLRLQGGYRYFRAFDIGLTLDGGQEIEANYDAHGFFVGLQWLFGGAADRDRAADRQEAARLVQPAPRPDPEPAEPPVTEPEPRVVTAAAPTAEADRAEGVAGQEIRIPVLANDSDPDGGPLRIVSLSGSGAERARIAEDGQAIVYLAPVSFSGTDRLSYRVEDATGRTARADVQVDVDPAPVPGPFLVFFDFNSADLSDIARTVIAAAAEAYEDYEIVRIEAVGHTDTSGSAAYNRRLAERRAEAVKAGLVAQGVPTDRVAITAKGEADPLLATGDGVREPQNRRVEIFLQRPGT